MEYKFSGKITLDDYIEFNKYFYIDYLQEKRIKRKYLIFIIITGIFFSIVPMIKRFTELSEFGVDRIIEFIVHFGGAVLIGIIFFLLYSFFCKIYLKMMKNTFIEFYNSNKLIAELTNYCISEDTIKMKSESEEIILTKEKIYKIKTDKDSIYIYSGLNAAYIIKKHFFENENEFDVLLDFMKQNYEKHK